MKNTCKHLFCSNCHLNRRQLFCAAGVGISLAVTDRTFSEDSMKKASESKGKKELKLVTFCGLYCGLCAMRARIPKQATALKTSLSAEGIEYWGKNMKDYQEFWGFLSRLSEPDTSCPGCRQGGGYPGCEIRKCAQQKKIEICPMCADYPCDRIKQLGRRYPTLIADGKRLKEISSEKWIKEQEKRALTGFAYVDIRNES
jgi:hypothetical protein